MNGTETPAVMYKGIKISNANYTRTYATLSRIIAEEGKGYVCLNDVGNLMAATGDHELKVAINEATFSLADGMPLARYAQLLGCTEIERISGAGLMKRMLSERDGFKHFLLGDTEETLAKVIREAKKLNGDIKIAGHSPPFRAFEDEDNERIMGEIRNQQPDIIWVSLGGIRQEKWIHRHINRLDRGIMIGAGAAFRWVTGDLKTPPEFIQTLGFQWAYRLLHECLKGPKEVREFCRTKKFLRRRLAFLASLPSELLTARKILKEYKASPDSSQDT